MSFLNINKTCVKCITTIPNISISLNFENQFISYFKRYSYLFVFKQVYVVAIILNMTF